MTSKTDPKLKSPGSSEWWWAVFSALSPSESSNVSRIAVPRKLRKRWTFWTSSASKELRRSVCLVYRIRISVSSPKNWRKRFSQNTRLVSQVATRVTARATCLQNPRASKTTTSSSPSCKAEVNRTTVCSRFTTRSTRCAPISGAWRNPKRPTFRMCLSWRCSWPRTSAPTSKQGKQTTRPELIWISPGLRWSRNLRTWLRRVNWKQHFPIYLTYAKSFLRTLKIQ